MKIVTDSIKTQLEIQLNKSIDFIMENDLKNVVYMTIDRMNYAQSFNNINYDEISLLVNLKELSIFNCIIDDIFVNNILKLKHLNKLNMYNCSFASSSKDMFDNLDLKSLTLSNCYGLEGITLRNLDYLELKNIDLNFYVKDIDILNIACIHNDANIDFLDNIKRVIIFEKDYESFNNIHKLSSNIDLVDLRMNVVKEI
jgi:hypothetical protein